ncbi:T9SS type A sorting domain-containing protein [Pontibacter sp. G13]|uniref:T9SS type A sorting domain-containing protein n=1 Tax=Pontibacter sp. G13 TaxID=3074898 RepID=UPI00288B636E|nr:T9SS type A sorting domain-containing protein [Pontibacter sp. G13]WNJ15984.1 T9SS type A sorting domain-containing protein [Pontibacter sp. G13]
MKPFMKGLSILLLSLTTHTLMAQTPAVQVKVIKQVNGETTIDTSFTQDHVHLQKTLDEMGIELSQINLEVSEDEIGDRKMIVRVHQEAGNLLKSNQEMTDSMHFRIIRKEGHEGTMENLKLGESQEIRVIQLKNDEGANISMEELMKAHPEMVARVEAAGVDLKKMESGEARFFVIRSEVTVLDETDFESLKDAGTDRQMLDSGLEMEAFNCYPNPSDGQFTVDAIPASTGNIQLTIRDLQGKICYSHRTTEAVDVFQHQFDLSQQPAGMYILTLTQGDRSMSRKIILE